jgi:hypothetical protein
MIGWVHSAHCDRGYRVYRPPPLVHTVLEDTLYPSTVCTRRLYFNWLNNLLNLLSRTTIYQLNYIIFVILLFSYPIIDLFNAVIEP